MKKGNMKSNKSFRFALVLFFGIISLSMATNVWASAFSIIDTQNEIAGLVTGFKVDLSYHMTSNSPLSYEIQDTTVPGRGGLYSSAESIAAGPYVYVHIEQPGSDVPWSEAAAISKIDFIPNFDGYAQEILFYGSTPLESWGAPWLPLHYKAGYTITDLTSNILIADYSFFGTFSEALRYKNGNDYFWDSTHIYELILEVQTGSNHSGDRGWAATDMFSINVPEPATMLLLGCGLLGLVGLWKRFNK